MKRFITYVVGVVGLVALLVGPAVWLRPESTANRVTVTDEPETEGSKRLAQTLKPLHFSGTALLIHQGQVENSYVAGMANDQTRAANTLATAYSIDSLQKVVTAGLVMKQIQANALSLTDRLARFYPQVKGAKQITIRQLLDMRSGLVMPTLPKPGAVQSDAQMVDYALTHVSFAPTRLGTWNYQGVNYVLLAGILTKVTGRSYHQLLDEMMVKPLRLRSVAFSYHQPPGPTEAAGYVARWDASSQRLVRRVATDAPAIFYREYGTGQLEMAPNEYYRLVAALVNGTLLGSPGAAQLLAPKTPGPYHAGMYLQRWYSTKGYGYGFQTHLRISQDGQDAVVVFSNQALTPSTQLKQAVDRLAEWWLGGD